MRSAHRPPTAGTKRGHETSYTKPEIKTVSCRVAVCVVNAQYAYSRNDHDVPFAFREDNGVVPLI